MNDNPVHQLSPQARSFWAKTGVITNDFGEEIETGMELPQHMLDSACVAGFLWDNWISAGSKKWLRESLELDDADTKALVRFLIGTHDIGKATPEFAGQLDSRGNPDLAQYRQKIVDAGFEFSLDFEKPDVRCPHSTYSQTIIEDWLIKKYSLEDDWELENVQKLAHVSGSHHGVTSSPHSSGRNDGRLINLISDEPKWLNWQQTWDELLTFIMQFTGAEEVLGRIVQSDRGLSLEAQFFITGLTIMSDWIASNPEFFPYGPVHNQDERVQKAFEEFHLPQSWKPESFEELSAEEIYKYRFGWDGDIQLRPMQKVVVDAAQAMPTGGLICIEAPMGQGKTEAGLVAAEILAAHAGKSGVMFAAPTQATANSLFTRVARWGENAAGGLDAVSMYLGHSKQNLNKDFQRMRYARIKTYEDLPDEKRKSTAYVHSWFSRKKGLLSTMVVGTIDQVLMMGLTSRHVMLRHLGLGEKVVIIDEVHAYDAYMNTYLKTALYWLGKMRAPVVLMSATLPSHVREDLLKEYARGLGLGRKKKFLIDSSGTDYPVIHTLCAEEKGKAQKWDVEQSAEPQKFSLKVIGDSFEELDSVLSVLEDDGGCAAIICNTVARAQEAYDHLLGLGIFSSDEVMLVHSRFISLDRAQMEEELISRLGKNSSRGRGRPNRFIVVGTQVIEQSLDIDFDIMVTDHAPVDLVLQRMGRLHRHKRGENRPNLLREPMCYVRGVENLGTEMQVPVFPKAANFIYAESILLSSYAQMMPYFEGNILEIPTHISEMVQGTYSELPILPESWTEHWHQVEAERQSKQNNSENAAKGSALRNVSSENIVLHNLVSAKGELKEKKAEAKVRETDDTLEVIVIEQVDSEHYLPLGSSYQGPPLPLHGFEKPEYKLAEMLAGSTIRLPFQFSDKTWNGKNNFDLALAELEDNLIEPWQQHFLLEGQLALILDSNGEATLCGYTLRYSKELGLQVITEESK